MGSSEVPTAIRVPTQKGLDLGLVAHLHQEKNDIKYTKWKKWIYLQFWSKPERESFSNCLLSSPKQCYL
jgi:hypothetical protein